MVRFLRKNALTEWGILFFWLIAIFDPVNSVFGLRYVAIAVAIGLTLARLLLYGMIPRFSRVYALVFMLFAAFLPAYGLFVCALRGGLGAKFIDTSYFASSVYFVCSVLYLTLDDIDNALGKAMTALRFLCLVIFLYYFLMASKTPMDRFYTVVTGGVAFLSRREYGGVSFPYVYFIASPMLVLLLCRDAWTFAEKPTLRNLLLLAMPILALFLSGTRMQMLAAFMGAPFVFLWRKHGKNSIAIVIAAGLLLGVALFASGNETILDMLSLSNSSNSIKFGYIPDYLSILSDPATLVFGQGFNAQAWSSRALGMIGGSASKTELTYLEMFRVFGLAGCVAFAWVMFRLIREVRSMPVRYGWIAPCLVVYLLITSLNPYLFSSNGMCVIGLCAAMLSQPPKREIVSG